MTRDAQFATDAQSGNKSLRIAPIGIPVKTVKQDSWPMLLTQVAHATGKTKFVQPPWFVLLDTVFVVVVVCLYSLIWCEFSHKLYLFFHGCPRSITPVLRPPIPFPTAVHARRGFSAQSMTSLTRIHARNVPRGPTSRPTVHGKRVNAVIVRSERGRTSVDYHYWRNAQNVKRATMAQQVVKPAKRTGATHVRWDNTRRRLPLHRANSAAQGRTATTRHRYV
jgi:hypothetical protein